ncbi:hypothetical protein NCCP2495_05410 [Dietzia sp. NCCP-2495]|uniref:phage tail tube protein n=1 Tax=Dietzia sp. NCCP-2495 TaxID=2934675 RepID=UPI00222EF865|nr:hypothetical protein [Dietzia sp. NCCP-2495]GLB62663.1 hypothetical protein NCCP2495_05410 [Dietzia sp. NCCP-2495]
MADIDKTGPNYDPDAVDFAKEGAVSYAPLGTAEPTGLDPYEAEYVDLGWLSTDGIEESLEDESANVQVWQAAGNLKEWRLSRAITFGFTMMARSISTLSVFYGIPEDAFELVTPTEGDSYYEWTDGGVPKVDERLYSLDIASGGGTGHDRIIIPRGTFTPSGAITYNRDGSVQMPGSISCQVNQLGYSIKRRSSALVLPTP